MVSEYHAFSANMSLYQVMIKHELQDVIVELMNVCTLFQIESSVNDQNIHISSESFPLTLCVSISREVH